MQIENERIEVDGDAYELRPWGAEDGAKWQGIVMEHVLNLDLEALQSGDEGHGLQALRGVLQPFMREHWLAFWKTCVRYTGVVGKTEDGRQTVQPLDKIETTYMQRRANARFALMRAHFEAEFGDFFKRGLRDALADLAASGTAS